MEDNMMLFCHNTCTHDHEGTLIYPGETMSSPSHFQDYWTNVSPQTQGPRNCSTLCSLSDHNPATTVSPSAMLEESHREALCSEREEWFKRQSCSPQWHVGLSSSSVAPPPQHQSPVHSLSYVSTSSLSFL